MAILRAHSTLTGGEIEARSISSPGPMLRGRAAMPGATSSIPQETFHVQATHGDELAAAP
ncbi:hypothetical protein WMF39_40635 [Sorangium sp. So ce1504]|uniref:hypothetical protein n=1 Tax=Sorangium sp. So ce1504 TaxID=3133337 RepID=UPI003F5F714B